MIAYFDTSALIPLLVEEPTSGTAAVVWDTSRAVRDLEALYNQLDRIDVDDQLVRRAGVLAEEQRLRGYDAIHLAAAERVADADTVVVAGDAELCRAAQSLRLHVTKLTTAEP